LSMIEAHELTRYYGKVCAVDKLSLKVEKSEVLGFLGPNGAGKTTTIRMLSVIIAPTSGYAVIAGRRTDGSIEQLHQVIGLLTESPGFYNRLSAYRNLEYFAGFYPGIDIPGRVGKYLQIMGLGERQKEPVGTYSKGMKQRLALARALVHEPQVLFLDEPTAGLDPEAAENVRGLIKKLSSEGRTIFLSTHNLSEAEQLCHRIAVFRNRLLALDKPENLRKQMFHRKVIIRLENINDDILGTVKKNASFNSFKADSNQLFLELEDNENQLPELVKNIVLAGGRILEVKEEHHSLEEIYLSLVEEEAKE